jgi:hypothetical protein
VHEVVRLLRYNVGEFFDPRVLILARCAELSGARRAVLFPGLSTVRFAGRPARHSRVSLASELS